MLAHVRIGVLADIHGNSLALQAVLEDVSQQSLDEVLVGGDLVGRGPEGSRVTRSIQDLGWRGVRGNHEDYLLDFRAGRVPDDWLQSEDWAASRWMADELTPEDAAYLDALPMSITSDVAPDLRLVHGSPRSHGEGLGPWSTDNELEGHAASVEEGLLVCAHTHRPMQRHLPSGRIVNVGAVGLPFNRDRRAQYAIFETTGGGDWNVEFRQVEYDLDATLSVYRSSGFERAGGVTTALLRLELLHAAPFLVPFESWARSRESARTMENVDRFLGEYDAATETLADGQEEVWIRDE